MMNKIYILLFLFIVQLNVNAQNELKSFQIDGIYFSLNRSEILLDKYYNDYYKNRIGFGLGFCKILRRKKKNNFVWGLEYNRINQFHDINLADFYGYLKNVKLGLNNISSPFLFRLNLGTKKKFFIDTGIFGEITYNVKANGNYKKHGVLKEEHFKGIKQISNKNFGIKAGFGYNYFIKERAFSILFNYRFSLTRFSEMYKYESYDMSYSYFNLSLIYVLKK
jgi:hypothetical protein